MGTVFLAENPDVTSYPNEEYYFSPKQNYPEYPWGSDTMAQQDNRVNDSVRERSYLTG